MVNAITEEISLQIDKMLRELLVQAESDAVFLVDRGGNIIAQETVESYAHEENIAALASGSFFATLEMARLVGEDEFQSMLHQGEKISIYMEGTSGEMLLVVVFGKYSNVGLVKLYTKKTGQQLGNLSIFVDQLDSPNPGGSMMFEIDETAQPFMQG